MTKRNFLALFGVLAIAVLVASTPAGATCGVNQTMGTYASSGPDYYGIIADPGAGLGSLQADYWQLGAGNPAIGLGKDNGSYQSNGTGGSQPWFFPFGTGITSGWGTDLGVTDGCPNDGSIVVLGLYDQSADGQHAYMQVVATTHGASPTLKMDFALGGDPALVEIPRPTITGSTHSGTTRNITLSWANNLAQICKDSAATGACATAITGWDVYKLEKSKSDNSPDNNRAVASWVLVGNAAGGGANTATVNFACTTTSNTTAQLALVPHLDSGFVPHFVGSGSTKIECDPTLADPSPKFKIIDKNGARPKTPLGQ